MRPEPSAFTVSLLYSLFGILLVYVISTTGSVPARKNLVIAEGTAWWVHKTHFGKWGGYSVKFKVGKNNQTFLWSKNNGHSATVYSILSKTLPTVKVFYDPNGLTIKSSKQALHDVYEMYVDGIKLIPYEDTSASNKRNRRIGIGMILFCVLISVIYFFKGLRDEI